MTLFDWIRSLVLLAFFALVASCLFHEKAAGISPTPVLPWVRRKAMAMVPPEYDKTKCYEIADLGCGWGGLLTSLACAYPQSRVTGYEISPFPYWVSKFKALLFGGRVQVKRDNFFKENISRYDLVFCYLSPQHMELLKPQLKTLAKGSVIVSCSFSITGWDAIATESVKSLFVSIPIFVYRI